LSADFKRKLMGDNFRKFLNWKGAKGQTPASTAGAMI